METKNKNDGILDALAEAVANKIEERLIDKSASRNASCSPEPAIQYLTVKDICTRYHISKATIYRHREAGFLTPSLYVGRKPLFTSEDIARYLEHFNTPRAHEHY